MMTARSEVEPSAAGAPVRTRGPDGEPVGRGWPPSWSQRCGTRRPSSPSTRRWCGAPPTWPSYAGAVVPAGAPPGRGGRPTSTTGSTTEFRYLPGSTTVSTPTDEVLRRRQGVCQDFAHLAIGCLRSVGLAARYVSGYLETRPPEGEPTLVGAGRVPRLVRGGPGRTAAGSTSTRRTTWSTRPTT